MLKSEQTGLIIESAVKQDIAAVTAIYSQAVLTGTASFELVPPDEAEMTRRWQVLDNGNFPYLVAKLDGKLAGYAYAGPFHTRPGYKWSVENTVYIDPEFQKNGLGTALLKELIEICTLKNYRQMVAVIGDSNNHGSIELHKKLGFELVGINKAVGRKFDTWLDIVVMQLELGEGAGTSPQRKP